ncbi:MAG: precorrin-6A reductase [Eubacteriales bacterium]
MILILGGTLEGREIADAVARLGFKALVTVVSGYGAEMIPQNTPVEVLVGRLDSLELEQLIRDRGIQLIVDATHPYAYVITETAWKTAQANCIPYIRYERPPVSNETNDPGVYRVKSYGEAAELSTTLGETVFLTIGSKNLEPFLKAGKVRGSRVVARVLPDAKVLEQCSALGIASRDIIAVQGPFSLEMNLAMLREYGAGVLVTKDSGHTGGTDTKLAAAARLNIPVVIVSRPESGNGPVTDNIPEILDLVKKMISK